MKKFFLLMVASLFVTGAFAQDWSVGGRLGSGFQAVGQYTYNQNKYVEARFGAGWLDGVTADFTALHNWNILTMDWTPRAGEWFFDAGVGLNIGGKSHYSYLGVACDYSYFGVAGMARLGFTFNNIPLTLSVDYTPVVGPYFVSGFPVYDMDSTEVSKTTFVGYRAVGFANFGITCTYNF